MSAVSASRSMFGAKIPSTPSASAAKPSITPIPIHSELSALTVSDIDTRRMYIRRRISKAIHRATGMGRAMNL